MAPVSSTSVRPPSVECASPRSAMTVNPLRPPRFWRPLRRPNLFSPLRDDRNGYAHRFLMWCIYSVVPNLGVLGRSSTPRPVSPFSAGAWTVFFHELYVKTLMALVELVQWRCGNLVFFSKERFFEELLQCSPRDCCVQCARQAASSLATCACSAWSCGHCF